MNTFGVVVYPGLILLLLPSYFHGLVFRYPPSGIMAQCHISVLVRSLLLLGTLLLAVTESAREIASHLPSGFGHFHFL